MISTMIQLQLRNVYSQPLNNQQEQIIERKNLRPITVQNFQIFLF